MNSRCDAFAALHRPGDPVLLYNIWDAGSARAVAAGGAPALATGSHSLAEANGYPDGEGIPFELFLEIVRRIVECIEVPLSVDFEGGFADDPAQLAEHAHLLAETGAVGCNFEDQVVGGEGLHDVEEQVRRIAAVVGSGLFVNARTDLFLKPLLAGGDPNDRCLLVEALERAAAYKEAGARSFFVPGMTNVDLIAETCGRSPLPVNVMMRTGMPDITALADAGVARISWGPGPWRKAMARLTEEARELYFERKGLSSRRD
jgi:2-methylisocitrate lyase-like PEP mutase family enzyme